MKKRVVFLLLLGFVTLPTFAGAEPVKFRAILIQRFEEHRVDEFLQFYSRHMPAMLERIEIRIPDDLVINEKDEKIQRLARDAGGHSVSPGARFCDGTTGQDRSPLPPRL